MMKVNFEVLSIEKAEKNGFVKVSVKFNENDKVYSYTRRRYGNTTIIDGCEITFNEKYEPLHIERLYDTKGIKKTSSNAKKNNTIQIPEAKPIKIEKVEEKKSETKLEGEVRHERYDDIKTCLDCNIPVYLAGPAGSGKNFTLEQIARENGWNFYFSNSVQQEYKLTGFIDAGGKYHETEFYKACTDENECIFFLDEMDASIPEVLVLLNAAIANGYFEFPNGKVNLENVHFVAAGNTVGTGGDEMYTGRMVLDQATLDRFAIIEFNYSENIELHLAKGNRELVDFIHRLRNQAEMNGIRATFSYRCISMVTKLEGAGMKLEMILKISVFKGLEKDTINTFSMDLSNKYGNALHNLKVA